MVVYGSAERDYLHSHERITRAAIAGRLATLKGADFAGDYDPARRYPGPVYFVPGETLVDLAAARALGIRDEHDLFGGAVPDPVVATKAITHPLVAPGAEAPAGWSHEFARRVQDAVLLGFSAFTRMDARQAGARLLRRGPVRLKPVSATGGRGQVVVADTAALEAALDALEAAEPLRHGLVVEEDLMEVATYSVGQVRVAELVASYWGTQRLTPDNSGAAVYGGSDLVVVRGDFSALDALGRPEAARRALAQARLYDAAATACFPGLIASRRNYDVAHGRDPRGQWRCGVLEQSWRIGGASSAEVAALEMFRAEPTLQAVRAACFEIYGAGARPPPGATVLFCGTDERVGPITKCTRVERYGGAG